MRVDRGDVQIQEFAEGPRPFRALYEHWERHQWSPFAIDFSTDGASFAARDEPTRDGLVWVFAHRFRAEFTSPPCSRPSCSRLPTTRCSSCSRRRWATSTATSSRSCACTRTSSRSRAGSRRVKALADAQLDPVAAALFAALDGVVRALEASRDEDSFLKPSSPTT